MTHPLAKTPAEIHRGKTSGLLKVEDEEGGGRESKESWEHNMECHRYCSGSLTHEWSSLPSTVHGSSHLQPGNCTTLLSSPDSR